MSASAFWSRKAPPSQGPRLQFSTMSNLAREPQLGHAMVA